MFSVSRRFRTPVAEAAVLFDGKAVVLLLMPSKVVMLIRMQGNSGVGRVKDAHVRGATRLNNRLWHSVEVRAKIRMHAASEHLSCVVFVDFVPEIAGRTDVPF